MLKSLQLSQFTVFDEVTFAFGRDLNVFAGENGSGKTHVLKAAYCGIAGTVATYKGVRREGAAT
ncbi:MAG: AAA family ATPase [Acidobacteria bacterium]|nr:AAA family ATPase [Acidobacteriota bacterium]